MRRVGHRSNAIRELVIRTKRGGDRKRPHHGLRERLRTLPLEELLQTCAGLRDSSRRTVEESAPCWLCAPPRAGCWPASGRPPNSRSSSTNWSVGDSPGAVNLGAVSQPRTLVLRNIGGRDLHVDGIHIEGPNRDDFSVASDNATGVPVEQGPLELAVR